MKSIIKIFLLPISLWTACTNQQTVNSIPGIYVNHAKSDYSIANDTLLIIANPHNPKSYQVTRRTTFWRLINGQQQSAQHKIKSFIGVWDETKQVLQLTPDGSLLQFQPDQHALTIGDSPYRKL